VGGEGGITPAGLDNVSYIDVNCPHHKWPKRLIPPSPLTIIPVIANSVIHKNVLSGKIAIKIDLFYFENMSEPVFETFFNVFRVT